MNIIEKNVECFCIKAHMKDGFKIKKGKYIMTIDKTSYNNDNLREHQSIIIENAYEFEIERLTRDGFVKNKIGGNVFYKRNMFDKYFICGSELRKYKLEKLEKICK